MIAEAASGDNNDSHNSGGAGRRGSRPTRRCVMRWLSATVCQRRDHRLGVPSGSAARHSSRR